MNWIKDILKEPIQKRLFILITIFLIAFAVIISTNRLLWHYTSQYISSINSQHSRSTLGKILIRNLFQIEKDIYEISGDVSPKRIAIVEKGLLLSLNDIELILTIFQHGGKYEHAMNVNMENVDEINETISFTIDKSQRYNLEVINLSPKILDIRENAFNLIKTKRESLRALNDASRLHLERSFSIRLKQTDTLLQRSKENAARIFYDTNQEIQRLEQRFNQSTRVFAVIRAAEVIVALLIIFATLFTISRQIQTIIKERQRMTEMLQDFNDKLELRIEERTANLVELNKTLKNEIAERRRAEEKLKESETHFRNITENMSDWIWETDVNWRYTYCSDNVTDVLGYSPEEMLGKTLFDFMDPGEKEKCKSLFSEIAGGKKSMRDLENWYLSKNGHYVCLKTSGIPTFNEKGEITGYVGVDTDITELQHAREALKKSEEQFRIISSAANDAIIMIDNEGKVVYWNRMARKMFGYTNQEILGKQFHPILLPDHLFEKYNKGFAHFKQTGQGSAINKTYELTAVKKEGVEIPVEVSISAVQIDNKWHAVAIVRDITERKLAEKALRKAQEKLKYLSYVDGLTEINNRRYFDEIVSKEWNRAVRDSNPLSLIMIDIDFFKNYNDVYGHLKGDECLKNIADIILQSIRRPEDFAARFGGEEFVVVLPNTKIKGASHIAETIRSNVESAGIEHNNSSIAEVVTVSLGVASTIPQRGTEPDSLLAETDACLYRAKQEGRNRVVIHR